MPRRKLAKRVLWQFLDKDSFSRYSNKHKSSGLLNNRGYTFLSTSSEFEALEYQNGRIFRKIFTRFKRFAN